MKTLLVAFVAFWVGWLTNFGMALFGSKFTNHDKLVAKYGPPEGFDE